MWICNVHSCGVLSFIVSLCITIGFSWRIASVRECVVRNRFPGVAQLAERLLWEQEAAGSRPVTRTKSIDAPLV